MKRPTCKVGVNSVLATLPMFYLPCKSHFGVLIKQRRKGNLDLYLGE